MTLDHLRESWERKYSVIAEARPDNSTLLVVLRYHNAETYTCHRYIQLGVENWDVSVDHQAIAADGAMKWLSQHISGR